MGTKIKTPETQIIEANSAFSNNLYQILSKREGNVFFSPISIHSALSVLHQGAEDITAHVLSETLKNPNNKSTAEGYKLVIDHLQSLKHMTLVVANKIYLKQDQTKLSKEFEELVVKNFDSEVEFLSFENKQLAAKTVNDWVEQKTQNKIRNLLNENSISENTKLMIINAIYFKGEWFNKFNDSFTKNAKFYLNKDKTIEVKMMYQKNRYNYKMDDQLGAQIIEIPYKGLLVKMIIILPTENTKTEDLELKLSKINFADFHQNLESKDVHLYLPKFKIEETIKLNDVLIEMGLKNIFDMKQANFRKILDKTTPKDNLYVSDVLQKAFIEVNETGTVAAAATRVGMVLGCAPGAPKPIIFRVDRPAVFLLVALHGDIPNCLFYGRLSQPEF